MKKTNDFYADIEDLYTKVGKADKAASTAQKAEKSNLKVIK